jgi:hypothetical protein
MKYLYVLILIISSCTPDEDQFPICSDVESTYQDGKLHLKIKSMSDHITICHDYGIRIQCTDIYYQYYNCISMSVDDENIYIIDGTKKCLIW